MIDQIKIGKFIAEKRKEKQLTQMEIANMLNITDRAVSKWERGLSLPDSGIMLQLCTILGITVNELLTGSEIYADNDKETAANIIVEMKKKEEEANRYLLHLEWIICIISLISFLVILFTASYLFAGINTILAAVLTVFAFGIFAFGIYHALKIERNAGYYECKCCHYRYIPNVGAVIAAPHVGRTRYMKCPSCGERSWQKKVLSK